MSEPSPSGNPEDDEQVPARGREEAQEDRAVVLRNLGRVGDRRQPLLNDDDASRASNDVNMPHPQGLDTGSATLSTFLGMRPFLKTFFWVADRVGSDEESERVRCKEFKDAHSKSYMTCLVLDLVLVAICSITLIAIAGAVAWKTIFG